MFLQSPVAVQRPFGQPEQAAVRPWWHPWIMAGSLVVAVGIVYIIATSKSTTTRHQLRVTLKR
jgi:hypothetical protein